jgi:hypothetical protein
MAIAAGPGTRGKVDFSPVFPVTPEVHQTLKKGGKS